MLSVIKMRNLFLYSGFAIVVFNADSSSALAETNNGRAFEPCPVLSARSAEAERLRFVPVFRQIKEAGMTLRSSEPMPTFQFTGMADSDAGCALSCVRVQMERRLTTLAAPTCDGVMPEGISDLLAHLQLKKVLNSRQVLALSRLTSLLNDAVHGMQVACPEVSLGIKEESPKLLMFLEKEAIR